MALKKSELYSSLWASCDELRGGMDASQYKDYVLVLLFIKYISDKYAGKPFAAIKIPAGASFADMVKLKGKKDIGDQINKTIIAPLAAANSQLSQADFPDFNDPNKLGSGKDMVDRLTNLIGIFENPALDFSRNRADGDDILGDAYEFLMRHFATESGKSKGQFYTPAEVSRIMARVIGIGQTETSPDTTVLDPTCGSSSLLLKVADEARTPVSLYGQEKDSATSGLARMNMILHDYPTAEIKQGNTLANPLFKDGDGLKLFDFVVANPPFSDKRWSNGVDPENDPYDRFSHFGVPPGKQGDYAYLLHIIRSLKSTGKGACILPHGVLFRGNAEAAIRQKLIRSGYLKGIIGLPANLFYGTGIPACILVLDKEHAAARKGIFMIDASAGFQKDGNKNRLRSRDIHKIVDAFTKGVEIDGYSRMVPVAEIEKNDFNLNLPRYIDNREAEDTQDIEAHLQGGIPEADLEGLAETWAVCPGLRKSLFKANRPGYLDLTVETGALKETIHGHPEFAAFVEGTEKHFATWRDAMAKSLRQLEPACQPKQVIHDLSEGLLAHYLGQLLLDAYAVYQHLMDYWAETMQDDVYLIAADGWKAETYRILVEDKKGKTKDKGWTCDLVPKSLVVARYFAQELDDIESATADLEALVSAQTELEEEHGGEEGAFGEFEKINAAAVKARLKELKAGGDDADERAVLKEWLDLSEEISSLKKVIKDAEAKLDAAAYAQYPKLTEGEVKTLVVEDKWLATLGTAIHGEIDRIEQALTGRVKELADRYATPMPAMTDRVAELEAKVAAHLERMGFA
ncbi:N-6 DNA methylase [Haloferula sp. A504]|uniref:type I restriction-modification system subunit M n=1 Tax=Haloferula sp. A504 TaxID=3373601 RepID=UPI00379DB4CD